LKLMKGRGGDQALQLHPVFPVVREAGVEQPIVESGIVGQEKESLAIEIQPANGIAIGGDGKEIF
jgi:hypothetical protein